MQISLSENEQQWQRTVRELAQDRVAPGARERERAHDIPNELIRTLGARGLLGVNVPEIFGGTQKGVVPYVLAMREVAQADPAVAVTMAVTNMVAEVIVQFGSDAQRKRHVPRLTSGEYFAGAFALSEPGAGSDAASLATRAEHRGDQWILNGQKMWITSGVKAGVYVVWARTGGPGARGITCFLVEAETPGLSAGRPEDKMGLMASHTVSLTLEDVALGEDAVLGEIGDGFKIAMVALDGGRIGVASQAMGIGYAALDRAQNICGQPSGPAQKRPADHQAVQFALADMATTLDAAWLLTLRAGWLKERKKGSFSREAAMAKVAASEGANWVTRTAVDLLGSVGHGQDYWAGRLFRDCRVTQIYEGTSEVQRLVIGREVTKTGVVR